MPHHEPRPHQDRHQDNHHHPQVESSDSESSHHHGDRLNPRRRGRAFPPPNHEDDYDNLSNHGLDIPKFFGTSDPEAYLSWALKVDKIFRVRNFSNNKMVTLASLEFEEYALLWWEQLQDARVHNHRQPIPIGLK